MHIVWTWCPRCSFDVSSRVCCMHCRPISDGALNGSQGAGSSYALSQAQAQGLESKQTCIPIHRNSDKRQPDIFLSFLNQFTCKHSQLHLTRCSNEPVDPLWMFPLVSSEDIVSVQRCFFLFSVLLFLLLFQATSELERCNNTYCMNKRWNGRDGD